LVCEKAEGHKYTKALEWGVHVVSIEWLHHIVKNGYKEGSEDRFSFNNTKQQTDKKESGKKRKAAALYLLRVTKIIVIVVVMTKRIVNILNRMLRY